MTREKMADPRGSEYGFYVAAVFVATVVVAFYDDGVTADDFYAVRPRFTLRMSVADYPVWRSHVGLVETP